MEHYDPAHLELVGLYEPRARRRRHALPDRARRHARARLHPGRDHRRDGDLFADPAVRRVVVEPDVRNTAVHALNEAVGFVPDRRSRSRRRKRC